MEQRVETRLLHANRERHFLIDLRSPTRPEHHPQEVWFNPRHPGERESGAKCTVLGRVTANLATICLIDDDRFVIELSENVPTGTRPMSQLFDVRFQKQSHEESSGTSVSASPIRVERLTRLDECRRNAGVPNGERDDAADDGAGRVAVSEPGYGGP